MLKFASWHDNTKANKNNPDPDQWVGWGDRTVDEMAHAWVNITYMDDADFQRKSKSVRPRRQPQPNAIGSSSNSVPGVPQARHPTGLSMLAALVSILLHSNSIRE